MTSLSSLSPGDLERLSAYADGELTPQEAEGLRSRLEHDPALQQALAEIRHTAGLLRSLPALPPPRSFTLSRDRATAARRYPRLQLATALAGLALFLVAGVDVLSRSLPAGAPAMFAQERAAAPLPEAQMLQEAAAEQPPQEGLQIEAAGTPAPAQARLAATESAAGEPLAAEEQAAGPQPTGTASATEAAASDAVAAAPPALLAGTPTLGAELAAVAATPTAAAELAATMDTPTGPASGLGAAGAAPSEAPALAEPEPAEGDQAGAAQAQESETTGFRAAVPPTDSGGLGLALRLAEVGLGGAVVVLGALTVRARRRR
jgi:hypothetical protein